MITYFIKVIFCSGLFVFIYKILLEKERIHWFNRFYLLAGLVCSFIIPFITFTQYVQPLPVMEDVLTNTMFVSAHINTQQIISHSAINYQLIIALTIYITITTLLLFRFAINLISVLQRAARNSTIPFKTSKLVLIKQSITPHSFLGYIFINTEDYNNGNIEKEILLHEFVHVQQRHSLDILFVEILHILFWFNPFIFLYRKALLLNHEFLADEAVINKYNDVSAYQFLLLEKASCRSSSFITSQFNYSITKKRLLMMTRSKSLKKVLCKQLAIIPALGIALFFFSTKTSAQETGSINSLKKMETPSTQDGITKEQLAEYETIVSKAKFDKGTRAWNKFSDTDKSRLETLFLLMSKEQQDKQIVIFMPVPPPLPKSIPTKEQVNSWKNPKIYGLWINEKRVSNSELNKYTNTDFSQVFVSKLYGAAKKGRIYSYQVNLMTNEYYTNYYKQTIESKEKYQMAFRMKPAQGRVVQKGEPQA